MTRFYRIMTIASAALLATALLAPAIQAQDASIVDLAIATPELSTLVDAVVKADLVETLDQGGPFTVFAPTNDAFAAAGIAPADVDTDTLTAVLLDHVVSGNLSERFLRSQSRAAERLPTLGGLTLAVDRLPKQDFRRPFFSRGLGRSFFSFGDLAINGNLVRISEIEASNGTIYVIDGVLTWPAPSIADRAIATEQLSTLVEAVVKAGLVETLDEGGPFTVFAPTNDAFDAAGIDPANVDVDTLTAVLLDHVVPGEFTAIELFELRRTGSSLTTLGGLELNFSRFPRVNDVRVIGSNISASNGVIHLISGVLLEPAR